METGERLSPLQRIDRLRATYAQQFNAEHPLSSEDLPPFGQFEVTAAVNMLPKAMKMIVETGSLTIQSAQTG